MNKFDLASAIGLFVLTAGLASCSPEPKTSKDSFRAPPPVIITGKGTQGYLQWERESDKTLDLQNSFDVSQGNPAHLKVLAHCNRDKASFSETFDFTGRRPVKIFQVVPQDVLFDDLAKVAVNCDWELTLSNEAGSQHIQRIATVPLTDRGGAEVSLEKADTNERVTLVQTLKATGFKIRYRNQETAAVELVCRDLVFEALPFEKVLDLNQFNLHQPVLRAGRTPQIVIERPLQPCRIAVSEGGRLKQISPVVLIQMPNSALGLTVSALLPAHLDNNQGGMISSGVYTLAYADITIKNSATNPRFLKLPRTTEIKMEAVTAPKRLPEGGLPNGDRGAKRIAMILPALHTQLPAGLPVVKEDASGWTVSLAGGTSTVIRLIYGASVSGCVPDSDYFQAYAIYPARFPVTELTADQVQIETTPLGLNETSLNAKPETFRQPAETGVCR